MKNILPGRLKRKQAVWKHDLLLQIIIPWTYPNLWQSFLNFALAFNSVMITVQIFTLIRGRTNTKKGRCDNLK